MMNLATQIRQSQEEMPSHTVRYITEVTYYEDGSTKMMKTFGMEVKPSLKRKGKELLKPKFNPAVKGSEVEL